VKAFSDLDQSGRTARLRRLAMVVLARYDLAVAAVRPLSMHFNAIFRVDLEDGGRVVLRINRPGNRSLVDIRSELIWLDALRRETDLVVTEPLPTRDGDLVTTVATAGVPEPRHCAVFRWIDGRAPSRRSSLRTLFALGATMARLHDHADRFAPPSDFTERKLDQVWPFGRPPAIVGDEVDGVFTRERRAVLRESAARVEVALADLYADPAELRFLHADLHLGNVKISRAGLAVLDFDDSLWAHPVQDVGISFCYLQYHPNYPELCSAFKNGYTSLRPWPETAPGQVEAFAAARQIQLVSYLSHADEPSLAGYLPRMLETAVPRLSAWLQSSR
jgi:Ser/Thr protein kinase RdoA (MazF antagonist)